MNFCPNCGHALPREDDNKNLLTPPPKYQPDGGPVPCAFDNVPPNTPMGLVCPCPKHQVTC